MKPPEATLVSIFSAYVYVSVCLTTDYGHSMKPFLIKILSFGAFGVFSTDLSAAPILVL
jgi:hypothetical protein